jgi:hypothetical protein
VVVDIGVIVPSSVMAAAALATVVFAWRTWKLSDAQHRLQHDPELKIYAWPEAEIATTTDALLTVALAATEREKRSAAAYVEYRFALVNPGRVPVMVTDVKEEPVEAEGAHRQVEMRFPYFREPPVSQVMSGLPWLVPAQEFAVCWRYLSFCGEHEPLKDHDLSIRVTFHYHNGLRAITTTRDAQLRWGFDKPYPGEEAAVGGPKT